jgi:hypothetical protein
VSHDQAVLLMVLGALGVINFGGLWFAVRSSRLEWLRQGGGNWLEAIVGQRRWSRVNRWIRVAPVLTVISLCLLLAGAVLRFVATT